MSLKGSKGGAGLYKDRRHAANVYHYLVYKSLSDGVYLSAVSERGELKDAMRQFYEIDLNGDDLVVLMGAWVERYLTQDQKTTMLSALRQRKRRASGVSKNITISEKSHRMLTVIAEHEGLTLSEVLEKRLKNAYMVVLRGMD